MLTLIGTWKDTILQLFIQEKVNKNICRKGQTKNLLQMEQQELWIIGLLFCNRNPNFIPKYQICYAFDFCV